MKLRFFVTGSATVLAVWLGVTFVREVPRENYPQLGKGSLPLSAKLARPEAPHKPLIGLAPEDAVEVVAVELP